MSPAAGPDPGWWLTYDDFDPKQEGLREALCALGNGLFVTRGAGEDAAADGVHYPGTYVAGGYNQLESEVAGRRIVNEDLVNVPNWLPLTFRPEDGDWLRVEAVELLEYRQQLHLRDGVLIRHLRVRDEQGRETRIDTRRLVHMAVPNWAAIEYCLTPVNWSGAVRIRSTIDGSVRNTGVSRYRQLSNRHLVTGECGPVAPEGIFLLARTTQSRLDVAVAARTRLFVAGERVEPQRRLLQDEPDRIGEELLVEAAEGRTLRVEKVVALYTSRHRAISEPALEARLTLGRAPDVDGLLASHRRAWHALWHRFDVDIDGHEALAREQMILRLHVFHLLQTVSPHSIGLDVGVPARGLHGEAYRGHVFWDEVFILPFYVDRAPAITRSLLMYRYYRLDAARELARQAGCAGAAFPWQSSSDGRETTQEVHLNPRSGRWDPDHSRLQRHVNAAIVYNVWHYVHATSDRDFLLDYGAEIVLDVARFWSSLTTWNDQIGRFEILNVMGPDEYHEQYPGAERGGLRNNAYTNVMAVWCLLRALDVLVIIGRTRAGELLAMLDIDAAELDRWRAITERMVVPFHGDAIISQFEGYEQLDEFDWAGYRERYGNIERLDRILKAEDDSPDHYQVSKQADVDMLVFLLGERELIALLGRLGYPVDGEQLRRIVEYYSARTSHGSTLSRVVYASAIHRLDPDRGLRLFLEALRSDVDDLQEGTTAEGIHLGAMAGSVGILFRQYAGIGLSPEGITFEPDPPARFRRLCFRVRWHGCWVEVNLSSERLIVRVEDDAPATVPVQVRGASARLVPGEARTFLLPRPEPLGTPAGDAPA